MKALFVVLALCFVYVQAAVIPTEIMYNPRQGQDYEYLELHNTSPNPISIEGWNITKGFHFLFPVGASIPGDGYLVVANKRAFFMEAYGSFLPANVQVYGDPSGGLQDNGEYIELVDNTKTVVFSMRYSDEEGWPLAADGYGSSLELICDTVTNFSDPNSWKASPLPTFSDPLAQYSGSPGNRSSWYTCPPSPPSPQTRTLSIYWSEVMYHPVGEVTKEEIHEFIEFYNAEATSVDLENYKVASSKSGLTSMAFTFPANSIVSAKSFFLLVKNVTAFNAVYTVPGGVPIFGGYSGEIGNGGDRLGLFDSNGIQVEEVDFNDKFPWPIGADAFGADDDWLSLNLTAFKFKGLSLERVTFNISTSKKYNWVASIPTPGVVNSANRTTPNPVVTDIDLTQTQNSSHFIPNLPISVSIKIGPKGITTNVIMEYFIDDIYTNGEPINSLPMTGTLDVYTAILPAQTANSIVRYRFKAQYTGSNGIVVISPRSNDPNVWHGLFVAPIVNTNTTIYHLFIKSDDWTNLWTYCAPDSLMHVYLDETEDTCCILNPDWSRRVPAVLGYKKRAIDIFTRYQGSAYNRVNGDSHNNAYNFDPPAAPNPLLTLSWKFWLPGYNNVNSRDTIVLLKQRDDGCSYVTTPVMYELGRQLGLPTPSISFSRLHINGGYYAYLMDVDYYSSDQIDDFINDEYRKSCRHKPSEEVGIMFKAIGYGCDGPVGPASEEFLWPDACGTPTLTRIRNTFDQITHVSWFDGAQIIYNLTDYLDGNHALTFTEANPTARAWFRQNFDINFMLHYLTLANWAGLWDDINGNHMLYYRLTDKKWHWTLWDMDALFGQELPCLQPTCSLYSGERGQPVGQYESPGAGNILKDHFIKSFRAEIKARYSLFANTVLSVNNTLTLMNKWYNKINKTELNASPAGYISSTCMPTITNWHTQRNAYIKSLNYSTTEVTPDVCPERANVTRSLTSRVSKPGRGFPPSSVAIGYSTISLSWSSPNPNGSPLLSFTLERKTTGNFAGVYTGPLFAFVDSGLNPSTSYTYRIKATNALGDGAYSDEVTFITTSSVTTGVAAATTSPLTTSPVTTSPLTSSPITSAAVTTSPITTGSVTTGSITTATISITTGSVTTSEITSGDITTNREVTSASLTSAQVTTGQEPVSVTTGQVATTTGESELTTGQSSSSSGEASESGESSASIACISMALLVILLFI